MQNIELLDQFAEDKQSEMSFQVTLSMPSRHVDLLLIFASRNRKEKITDLAMSYVSLCKDKKKENAGVWLAWDEF